MCSFVEHFNVKSKKKKQLVIFQANVTKFNQKGRCTLSFCYTCLCARYSMKELINSFFSVKRSKEHHENAICMNFYFFNPKLSQKM